MLCTNCYNAPATYHYKTITNGVVKEEHLCKDCAMKLKYGAPQGGGLTDLLSGFFNTQPTNLNPVIGLSLSITAIFAAGIVSSRPETFVQFVQ